MLNTLRMKYELGHSISYKMSGAPSEDRSDCASAQSDQSFRCPPEDALDPWLSKEYPTNTLIRLHGYAGWSVFTGRTCSPIENAMRRLYDILLL